MAHSTSCFFSVKFVLHSTQRQHKFQTRLRLVELVWSVICLKLKLDGYFRLGIKYCNIYRRRAIPGIIICTFFAFVPLVRKKGARQICPNFIKACQKSKIHIPTVSKILYGNYCRCSNMTYKACASIYSNESKMTYLWVENVTLRHAYTHKERERERYWHKYKRIY